MEGRWTFHLRLRVYSEQSVTFTPAGSEEAVKKIGKLLKSFRAMTAMDRDHSSETATGETDRVNAVAQEVQHRGRHVWEYHERGAWKPCSEFLNDFLEEQLMVGEAECGIKIDETGDEKYVYNFPNLTQQRMVWKYDLAHPNNGDWSTVKVRSIRRIIVVAEPQLPRG